MSTIELAELICAARQVIAARDAFDGQDTLDTIDHELNNLRAALELPFVKTL